MWPSFSTSDAIGNLGNDGKVMADIDRGRAALLQSRLDRLEHFHLRGHVERGGRFVEQDQFRLGNQRHRRHHPLQLAAGDLVGIARSDGFWRWQSQRVEQRNGPRLCGTRDRPGHAPARAR